MNKKRNKQFCLRFTEQEHRFIKTELAKKGMTIQGYVMRLIYEDMREGILNDTENKKF